VMPERVAAIEVIKVRYPQPKATIKAK
jgi:hypothetical protein